MTGRGCGPELTLHDLGSDTRGLKVTEPDSERIYDVLGPPF